MHLSVWIILLIFFFSSRRRHTRFDCDWSSDVCSSDLKDSVYFKAQWWTSDNEGLGTSGWPNGSNGVDRWGVSSHYLYTDDGRSANWVHVFDPAVVNEFTFGWRDDTEGFVPSDGFAEGLKRS